MKTALVLCLWLTSGLSLGSAAAYHAHRFSGPFVNAKSAGMLALAIVLMLIGLGLGAALGFRFLGNP
jgi:hypothetical protein